MDSSVATLASSREDLETATKSVNKQYKVSKKIEQSEKSSNSLFRNIESKWNLSALDAIK